MSILVVLLAVAGYIGTVVRVTRLINSDTVLDPVRIRIARRFGVESGVVDFLGCPWCVSVWVAAAVGAAGVAVADYQFGAGVSWWWLAVGVPVASQVAGMWGAQDDDVPVIVDE